MSGRVRVLHGHFEVYTLDIKILSPVPQSPIRSVLVGEEREND